MLKLWVAQAFFNNYKNIENMKIFATIAALAVVTQAMAIDKAPATEEPKAREEADELLQEMENDMMKDGELAELMADAERHHHHHWRHHFRRFVRHHLKRYGKKLLRKHVCK